MKKKHTHGGTRKGSGRPLGSTTKEPSKVVRIPLSKLKAVYKLIGKKFQPVDLVLLIPAIVGLLISML